MTDQDKKDPKPAKELNKILKQTKAKDIAKKELKRRAKAEEIKKNLPSTEISLPLVALRQGVLFPGTELVLSFGRDASVKAVKEAADGKKLIVLVTQKDSEVEDPESKDLYRVGTLAVIERTLKTDDTLSALVRGLDRVEIESYLQFKPFIKAQVDTLEERIEDDEELDALQTHLKKNFQKIVQMGKPVEFLNFIKLMSGVSHSEMVDQIASSLSLKTKKKQVLLETLNLKKRMKLVINHLSHEMKVLEIEKDVVSKTQQKFNKHMRENILRERLKTIKQELGESEEFEDIAQEYHKKITEIDFPEDVEDKIKQDINRLEQMSPNNPESGYIRSWLDTMFDLPWDKKTEAEIDLKKSREILDQSHYGLKEVKDRVLEYIAVLELKKKREEEKDKNETKKTGSVPTILCFVGPPGVGKTSIGKAIAQALNRKFTKISLGGIRDEAQIRGHRRTYVGAMPGRIIKGIQQAGSKNPVFILDEIDKVGQDFRGDPTAALLEVLDPEQNERFEDHYLDVPFDLSDVIFITTANTLDTIPPALRDRMEIIRYRGYTYDEKYHIAKEHLLEKVLTANALTKNDISIPSSSLKMIIQRYTREAGVRELERKLNKVARKVAKKVVETQELDKDHKKIKVNKKLVQKFLGPEEYDPTIAEEDDQVGLATGLAWTSVGGDVLFIEVALTPGKGRVILTGKLGDVMKESAQTALTYIKSRARQLEINPKLFDKTDVHIHVPEGAIPKDGPSAGITLATAIASAFSNRRVEKEIAMTGEITLRGRVLRIGGLKEKAIAAHIAGIKTVLIPAENKRDLVEIPETVKKDIKFKTVKDADQVLEIALK